MSSVVLDEAAGIDRDDVICRLKERGIDSRPFFPPFSSFPMFQQREGANPIAARLARQGINLPSGHNLTEADVDRVASRLVEVLTEQGLGGMVQIRHPAAEFEQDVTGEIKRLQESDRFRAACVRQHREVGTLEPVGWSDAKDSDAIARLAEWREAVGDVFPARFPVTLEGTERWLTQKLLQVPDRLLFWVRDRSGQTVGHLGLFRFDYARRHVELDNVIRGVPGVTPGIMEGSVRPWRIGRSRASN